MVGGWEVSSEDEARNGRGGEEKLEVAIEGGEDPVVFAVVGNKHGGDSGRIGGGSG